MKKSHILSVFLILSTSFSQPAFSVEIDFKKTAIYSSLLGLPLGAAALALSYFAYKSHTEQVCGFKYETLRCCKPNVGVVRGSDCHERQTNGICPDGLVLGCTSQPIPQINEFNFQRYYNITVQETNHAILNSCYACTAATVACGLVTLAATIKHFCTKDDVDDF